MSTTNVGPTTALGQGDLPAAAFSFKAWVEINGVAYATVQSVVTHSKGESRAVCELAVGVNTRDPNGLPSIPANFKFTRGLPARVMIQVDEDLGSVAPVNDPRVGYTQLLKKGTHVLFDGVVDDGGPTNLVKGHFNLNVVLVSKLIYLATGSTQFTGLASDYIGGSIVSLTNAKKNPADILIADATKADFWHAMQQSFLTFIRLPVVALGQGATSLRAFLEEFGTNLATANQNMLNAIKGSLPGGVFKDTAMGNAVITHYNNEMLIDLRQQSILQRIRAYSEDFMFALLENGNGYAVVPYTPFVAESLIKTTIWPNTVYNAQWKANSTAMITGLAFMGGFNGNNTGLPTPNPQNSRFSVCGAYHRPGTVIASNPIDPKGDALGLMLCRPAPNWLTAAASDPVAKQRMTSVTGLLDTSGLRKFGDPYAREVALMKTYGSRVLVVECPLRMDIGPCTPIKLVYPDIAGTGLNNAAAVYGSVESVSIVIDATSKRANTVLEIAYVRSQQQQTLDIDPGPFGGTGVAKFPYPHPIWAGTYLGQRLDEAPDFQAKGSAVSTGSGGASQAERLGSNAFVNQPGTGSGTGSITLTPGSG